LRYRIQFSTRATEHVAALRANSRRQVVDDIERQLSFEPQLATRHRKRLRPNVLADWELRIGDFRVYYIVADEPEPTVSIIAVGRKLRNRVFIAGEELEI
jgi:mRNA-degrading endonuclease RelE of RelBE toxin-antitoxin system